MIIDERVEEFINSRNKKCFRTTLYCNCDQCGNDFEKGGSGYKKKEFHFCTKECVIESQKKGGILDSKKRRVFLEKYGCDNPSKSQEIKDKKGATCIENYGVDNPSKSEVVKKRKEETSFKNYGVSHPQKSEKVRSQTVETCIEKYGVSSYLQTEECRDALMNYSMDNYGVEHIMKSPEFIETFKSVFLEKYGVDNPMKVPEFVDKGRKTCIEKYGVDNALKLDYARERFFEVLAENGENKSSKIERKFHSSLLQYFAENDIISGYYIQGRSWLIDFYIKPIDLYVQFDGVFWHGLDEGKMKELKISSPDLHKSIARAWVRDREQDIWFAENGLNLIRITDDEYMKFGDDVIEEMIIPSGGTL